jgi:hypothetical protein
LVVNARRHKDRTTKTNVDRRIVSTTNDRMNDSKHVLNASGIRLLLHIA